MKYFYRIKATLKFEPGFRIYIKIYLTKVIEFAWCPSKVNNGINSINGKVRNLLKKKAYASFKCVVNNGSRWSVAGRMLIVMAGSNNLPTGDPHGYLNTLGDSGGSLIAQRS